MLLFKTYLAPSHIHGVGLFSDEFIPKGAIVWKFDPLFDKMWTDDQKRLLPEHIQEFIDKHGFYDRNSHFWVMDGGNDIHVNHSKKPNLVESNIDRSITKDLIAIKDIHPGEELLENYEEWDEYYYLKEI